MSGQKHSFDIIDLSNDERFHRLFYGNPSQNDVAVFNKILRNLKADRYLQTALRLYHGTAAYNRPNIDKCGLLATTLSRRNSLQSTSGYVYLSVFASMAEQFGRIASLNAPTDQDGMKVAVYAVDVPLSKIAPDLDQLRNQRMFAQRECSNSLAESLCYGHGIRVKGRIEPWGLHLSKTASNTKCIDHPVPAHPPGKPLLAIPNSWRRRDTDDALQIDMETAQKYERQH